MIEVDFDFARYVASRRGQMEQRARDGAAYAYAGEHKARRMLATARPVTIALEATSRRWRASAKDKLLSEATMVTDQSYPALREAANIAAQRLGLKCPPLFVAPESSSIEAQALGTDTDPLLAISESYVDGLDRDELVALVGHLLGHVQNQHILFSTALYYLRHDAFFFVRWVVQPAVLALQAWSRRADITCDRAAMLAAGDLDTALSAMIKTGTGQVNADVAAVLAESAEKSGGSNVIGIFKSHPTVPRRARAMRLFAEAALFSKVSEKYTGIRSTEDVDTAVSDLLSLF